MPLNIENNEYVVSSFIELEKDLAIWLKEDYSIDGEWTRDEKKRFINKGAAAIAARTLIVKKIMNFDVTGTPASPKRLIKVPDKVLKPMRLYIDSEEYKEMSLDIYLENTGMFLDPPTGSTQSTTQLRSSVLGSRLFWWDEASNGFRINPPITDTKQIILYAAVMPKLLIKEGDITDINPAWTHLISKWAAKEMLPQDEEHDDRGMRALQQYELGIGNLERFKRKDAGNKSLQFIKDPEKFPRRRPSDDINNIDLKTTWDRLN